MLKCIWSSGEKHKICFWEVSQSGRLPVVLLLLINLHQFLMSQNSAVKMKFDIVVLFYGSLEIADKFWTTVPNLTADFGGAASTVATWEVNTIWRTERFCGRRIHLRSASIAVSAAAAGVLTFILSFYLFFMPIYSFGPIERQVCVRALASHPRRVEAAGQDQRSSSPLHLLLRKKPVRPLCEIAPLCVCQYFSQSLRERWRRGPCRTRRCYGWKPTARQRSTRTADLDSTAAVGRTPASGRCFPITLYRPWACWALRRTTWVKVKKPRLTVRGCQLHIARWIIPHFHAVESSPSEETVCC